MPYSQNKRFNLDLEDVTIKEVLQELEAKSEFTFLYSDSKVNVNKKVDVKSSNETIEEIFDMIFSETNIVYSINDKQVVLSPANTSGLVGTSQQQKRTISGKVTDENGEPIPGVSILVRGTIKGVITDLDGKYALSGVANDAVLLFSFVGMNTQEVAVAGKTTLNIVMQEDAVDVDEVVVIGYGTVK